MPMFDDNSAFYERIKNGKSIEKESSYLSSTDKQLSLIHRKEIDHPDDNHWYEILINPVHATKWDKMFLARSKLHLI
jgi:hypothetical protein